MIVLQESVQIVREGEDDVKVRDRKQVLGLFLQPFGAAEPLTTRAMPIAARVWLEVFASAVDTPILMATQRRRATSSDGAKDLPMMSRQPV